MSSTTVITVQGDVTTSVTTVSSLDDAGNERKTITTVEETLMPDGSKKKRTSTKTITLKRTPGGNSAAAAAAVAVAASTPALSQAQVQAQAQASAPAQALKPKSVPTVIEASVGRMCLTDVLAAPVLDPELQWQPTQTFTPEQSLQHIRSSRWWAQFTGYDWASIMPHRAKVCKFDRKEFRGPFETVFDFKLHHACGGQTKIEVTETGEGNVTDITEKFISAPAYNKQQLGQFTHTLAGAVARHGHMCMGKQVGDGECWTFISEALAAAGARAALNFNFGCKIEVEDVSIGDVIHIYSATFKGLKDGKAFTVRVGTPNHVAIVTKTVQPGVFDVLEQNVAGVRTVQPGRYNVNDLLAGYVFFWRAVPAYD